MTTVSVTAPDSTLSLPEVLFSYWLPSREVLPRNAVYRPGEGTPEISEEENQLMDDSQSMAVVAALRQSGDRGHELADGHLGVQLRAVGRHLEARRPDPCRRRQDDRQTSRPSSRSSASTTSAIAVVFTVLRAGAKLRPTVITRATVNNPKKPIVGISLSIGYSYSPRGQVRDRPGDRRLQRRPDVRPRHPRQAHQRRPDRRPGDRRQRNHGLRRSGRCGRRHPGEDRRQLPGTGRRSSCSRRPTAPTSTEVPDGLRVVPVESLSGATEALQRSGRPGAGRIRAGVPVSDALVAALIEVERHVGRSGWDQPARLFALVPHR